MTTITVSSELMKNQIAGRVLASQKQIETVESNNGTPLVFSINENHTFCLTLHDEKSPTSWSQIDLTKTLTGRSDAQDLGTNLQAQSFAVSQDKAGTIWIALAVSANIGGASKLYLSKGLSKEFSATDWQSIGSHWQLRELPKGTSVTRLKMGTSDDDNGSPLVLAVAKTKKNGIPVHYRINSDFNDPSWTWADLTMPEDADECLDVAIGTVEGMGRGIYALYRIGNEFNLVFTSLPVTFDGQLITESVQLTLEKNLNPRVISALPDEDGFTDLYVSGDGIYRFPSSVQVTSYARGEQVADASSLLAGVNKLLVRQDSSHISLWGCNQQDQLVYTFFEKEGSGEWQLPIKLANEVTEIGAYRSTLREANVIVFGKKDGSIEYLSQDSQTKLWNQHQMSLFERKEILEFNSYTTRVVVRDDQGLPIPECTLQMKASSDCAVRINGEYFVLKSEVYKDLKTDYAGTLTIVRQTADLSTPHYSFKIEHLEQLMLVDPADKVKEELRQIKKGSDLKNAVNRDGTPLFPNRVDSSKFDKACDTAAKCLTQFMNVSDSLPPDGSVKQVGKRNMRSKRSSATGQYWGVLFTDEGAIYLEAEQAATEVATISDRLARRGIIDDLWLAAGDFFASIESGWEQVKSFFIQKLGDVFEFVVHLGEKVIRFVFEAVAQVFKAINWVLKELLGIDLEKFIKWLGFIFNWNDILYTHTALRNLAEVTFNHMMAQTDKLESLIQNGFEQVRKQLIGNKLEFDRSNEIFKKRIKEVARDQDTSYLSTPQANWAQYHLSNNWESATSENVDIVGELTQTFLDTLKTEGEIIENVLQEVSKDIIDKIDQLSFGEILEKLALIIGEALINSAENIALSFVEIAEVIGRAVWAILNARWDIPLITPLYENVIAPGSKLTLLDLGCLLTAIPSTIIYKTIYDKPPITKAEAEALSGAKNFQDIIQLLSGGMQAPAPRRVAGTVVATNIASSTSNTPTSSSDVDKGFARIQAILPFCLGATRLCSGVIYVLVESFDSNPLTKPFKQRPQEIKFCFDLLTYCFSFANATFYWVSKKELNSRQTIDLVVQYAQVLLRIKDGILIFYWRSKGKEMDKLYKDGLAWCETELGLITLLLVGTSTFLQAQEPLSTNPPISKQDSDILLGLKATQNICSSIYQILSGFNSYVKLETNPNVKAALVLTRVFISYLVLPTFTIARASKNFSHERQYLDW